MKLIRRNTFETNSSSTHALVIMSKEDYKAWQNNEKVLNLYTEKVEDLSDIDKKIIRNADGTVEYGGEKYDSEWDFMEKRYDVINDDNASKEYVDNFAEVEEKELDDKIIMSIYRGERW